MRAAVERTYLWTDILNVHRTVDALLNAFTWPGYGLQVGSAEDAQQKQEKRRLIELSQRSSRPMLSMCSEERDLSAPAACGGRGSGSFRCWCATEDGWSCVRPDIDGL